MAITDRGFCDLLTLAEKKFHGGLAKHLFQYATNGWQANNSFRMLRPSKAYKVVMQDYADEIVPF